MFTAGKPTQLHTLSSQIHNSIFSVKKDSISIHFCKGKSCTVCTPCPHLERGRDVLVHGNDGAGGRPRLAPPAPVDRHHAEPVLVLLLKILTPSPAHYNPQVHPSPDPCRFVTNLKIIIVMNSGLI